MVRLSSPDPRRVHAASLLRSQRLGLFADGDASVSGVEVLMALADELCATAPTVLVIDWPPATRRRRPMRSRRSWTDLTVHEIANELFLSANTVNTHRRNLYAKLGVHSRREAVDRARAEGLLAPNVS